MLYGPSLRKGSWPAFALPCSLVLLAATCDGSGNGRTTQLPGDGGAVGRGGATPTGGTWNPGTGGRLRSGGGLAGMTGNGGARAGGEARSTGGSRGTGGLVGTGGATSGVGGTTGTSGIRGLTPQQIVDDMGIGWNLGNSFDASPNETSWGNPTPTRAMVQAVKDAGFKTLRVPVTWTDHFGGAPNYTIDKAWLDKVEQTVKWVLDAGMYAVLNTHHDADLQWILLTNAAKADVTAKVTALWQQIATRFKSYNDYLIFETFNEPHGSVNPYNGGNAEQQSVLNAYIAAALAAIRGTGGNNALRPVMIQPHGASPYQSGIRALVIPDDPNLIISLHTYYPTSFSLDASPNTWGNTAKDYSDMAASLDQIKGWLPNRAIVIGEWGSIADNQLDARVKHAKAYVQDVVRRGMCPIWWDNGANDFALLNRKANPPSWTYPTILSALFDGAKAGAAPGAGDATMP